MGRAAPATFGLRALVSLAVLLLVVPSCTRVTKSPGQLVVAVSTDMALPDQIDTIQLQVLVDDKPLLDIPMITGTGEDAQPIPATLTLVAGPDPSVPAKIRVLGFHGNKARTLRQAVTTVPAEGTALLRMPVQWLCDGTTHAVRNADGDIVEDDDSECGPDNTCQAGRCVPSHTDSKQLPAYESGDVFGGGAAPPDKGRSEGTCFDTFGCLLASTAAAPDDQCTIPMPADTGSGVNVALRVANDGICDTTGTTCFVPLDESNEGWTEQDGRIALPPAVCTKLRNGLITSVVVSTTCETKVPSTPPCGPWSSVRVSLDAALPPLTVDASALGVPSLVASVVPKQDPSRSSVCCPLLADEKSLYTCVCSGNGSQIVSIDPSSGAVLEPATFKASAVRARYAAVLAGAGVYWVDRPASSGSTTTCLVNQTPVSGAAMGAPVATVRGDVYDGADLLADATNLYALADNVADLAPGASAVQLLRIDRASGLVTPFDTGGVNPLLQFTQDAKAVYAGVDTDVAQGDAGIERISRIIKLAKSGGAATTVTQKTLTISDSTHGGFVGLQSDGTSLYAIYEATPDADGNIDLQVQRLGASPSDAEVLYEEHAAPPSVRLRLLGAVSGAVVLARGTTLQSDAGPAATESTVIVLPASGSSPRTVASFKNDAPLFELQVPTFTADVFWMNQSGRVFRLSAAGLR